LARRVGQRRWDGQWIDAFFMGSPSLALAEIETARGGVATRAVGVKRCASADAGSGWSVTVGRQAHHEPARRRQTGRNDGGGESKVGAMEHGSPEGWDVWLLLTGSSDQLAQMIKN
jgi:hypothetical protein